MIEWLDSRFSLCGWINREQDCINVGHETSVGIVTNEDDEAVELSPCLDKEGKGQVFTIPKCSIKRIRRLTVHD